MHSHDKTMLSKLGFSDPDKRNPKHDLACLYVASPEIASKVLARFETLWKTHGSEEIVGAGPIAISTELEHHLQKGEGKYATTIGFIDVVYKARQKVEIQSSEMDYGDKVFVRGWGQGEIVDYGASSSGVAVRINHERRYFNRDVVELVEKKRFSRNYEGSFLVEVKIEPVGYGEILRQLNLYKSYFPCNGTILITAWPLAVFEKEAIEKAGATCLPLGDRFEAWSQEKMKAKELDLEGL